jgi:cation-transporting ATPase 13A3/4/5
LTKEGLEFFGAQPIIDSNNIVENRRNNQTPDFDKHQESIENIPRLMQIGLATCHAVTTLNGQFIGNPVDIEMFRSSKWQLSDESKYVDTLTPSNSGSEGAVHVLKRYEFVHARMSMSVAVLDSTTNKVHIFVKGAYEKIKDLSNPESFPADYDRVTANHARQGCYVLALSHREINLDKIPGGLDAFSHWTRDQMEENINFLGLIIFKNQLKEDTTENVAELKRGDTRTIMITGDTALTGVYIARQCGMALQNTRVLLGDFNSRLGRVVWTDVDEPDTFSDVNVNEYLLNKDHTPVELAVTGKAFDWLVDCDLIRKYLLDIRVFARMTPNGKVKCVQLHMERGITAMTGDGGNDCGALRAAHVGIAMSDAEASIVSPFSTSHRTVRSCVELVRQGRGALATSLTCYKYLILYGQVMMMLKIFTFYFDVTVSQNSWIFVDVFITVLLTWAVSQSRAAKHLEPQRPTARLLGPQTLASGMGVVAINWLFLIGAFAMLYKQPWFRCNEFSSHAADMSKWYLLADNYEAEVLAFVCLFQFINNAAVFNFGYMFRKAFWRNYWLVILWLFYLAVVSSWMLADPNSFGCIFRMNCGTKEVLEQLGYSAPSSYVEPYNTPLGHNVMPKEFRWRLWGLCIGNCVATLFYEKFFVLGPIHTYLARKFPVKRLQKTL